MFRRNKRIALLLIAIGSVGLVFLFGFILNYFLSDNEWFVFFVFTVLLVPFFIVGLSLYIYFHISQKKFEVKYFLDPLKYLKVGDEVYSREPVMADKNNGVLITPDDVGEVKEITNEGRVIVLFEKNNSPYHISFAPISLAKR